jgi:glycosyltransferase involved in cell wall biosynthesis
LRRLIVRLKVVLISYFSQALAGGVASVAHNLVRSLGDKVDLHVICEKGGVKDPHVTCYELPDPHIPHGRFLACHLSAGKIVRMIERIDPDIIHANYVHMLLYASRVIKKTYPLVVTAHATPYRELEALVQHPTLGWELAAGFSLFPYWHLVDRDVLMDSEMVIAVSPLVKQDLIQVYHLTPESIVVIPNSVDTDRFVPSRHGREHTRRILSVGRLAHRKGFAQLVRAMRIVRNEDKDICLRIVGTGPEMPSLKKLAASLGLADSIEFLGHICEERLAIEYQSSELVVMPSEYEPCSMVTLEAMSSGTPVAMSPHSGVARLVRTDECFVPIDPSDVMCMAKAIRKVLGNTEELAELGRRSRLVMEREFSPEATATKLIRAYESALQKKGVWKSASDCIQ